MITKSDEFIKELDDIMQRDFKEKLLAYTKEFYSYKFIIKSDAVESLLKKYELTDFTIMMDYEYRFKITYCYKGLPIEPKGYWMLPENGREPLILEILHECIKQDTNEPDIKHLEDVKEEEK